MSNHSLQRLLSLLGSNWRYWLSGYSHEDLTNLVGFYLPHTTPSEREALAKELEDLL